MTRRNPRTTRREPGPVDRLPPHSVEAEAATLGCVVLDAKACLVEVANRVRGEAFYDLRHQVLFHALLELQNAGSAIDLITLRQYLKDKGRLADAGGDEYVMALPDQAASALNLEEYLRIVHEKWILRRMVQLCGAIGDRVNEYAGEASALVAEVQADMMNLPTAQTGGPRPLGAWAEPLQQTLENYARGRGLLTGLPTGFAYWDKVCAGMHPAEVIVIGGDPGMGKTSLVMNVAERVAVEGHNPVGVISLEMSGEDLTLRLACSRVRVNFHKLRTGTPLKSELAAVKEAMTQLMDPAQVPIYVDDAGGLTLPEVRARLRAMKHRYDIRLAVVDYLQLVALTREQAFMGMAAGYADVARGLQQAAKELKIPIIVVSQLSNEGRKRGKNERPRLTDFRETGAIGDVANFAGILWRRPLEAEAEKALREAIANDPMGNHVLQVQMEILKNKNGPSGSSMQFLFQRWCMRFEDLQHPSQEPERELAMGAAGANAPEDTDELL